MTEEDLMSRLRASRYMQTQRGSNEHHEDNECELRRQES